jgi:hypothetical protein
MELEKAIGRRLDIVHVYTAWGETWGRYNNETIKQLYSATSSGRRALITWEPWVLGQGVDQDDFSLGRIAIGDYDVYIRMWARGLRGFPGVVFLRPMHEMNGDWYPWCVGVNGNSAQDYVRAWQRMWTIFAQERAFNVRWVWCPYSVDSRSSNGFELTYPGGQYVDILGLDVYNWGTQAPRDHNDGEPDKWEAVNRCLGPAYSRISSLGPQPMWLPEIGCAERGGDKAQWLGDLLDSPDYDRISALIFFDTNKERDWRVNSSPASRVAVSRSLAGTSPASEAEIAPAPPFEVQAERGSKMIKVSWSAAEDVSALVFVVSVFAGSEVLRTFIAGPSSRHYVFTDMTEHISYSFAVQAASRFGASAMSQKATLI